ncbi:hypothetical protein [Pedobacter sp. HMWF019]|uniref:hypothetical protein n=1 Tax=Pedobacter sp. HMWF019 TaxID=2056856 RepID=UPI0011B28B70|nr:hypothetical protein [Pedobacter sp. HMWF019]
MEENKITNAQLNFTCHQDWNSMKDQGDGKRHCSSCEKMVYDLTDKNVAYFIQIMQENNNNVCGRFSTDQLKADRLPKKNSLWKKWVIAAMVFVGLGSLMTKASAQESKLGKVLKPNPDCQRTVEQQPVLMGKIAIIHDPVDDVLYDYLIKNCKVPASAQGRLILTFNLKQDGTIDRLAVNDHLPKTVSDEVLKVIRKAPIARMVKKEVLKQSARPHTLHLTFERGKMLANSY